MASLHKRSASPYWWGKFTDDTGATRFRSTKKLRRDDALEILLAWQRSAVAARNGELTKAAVLKTLNEMLERTTGERLDTTTVADFFAQFLRAKTVTGKAESTVSRYTPVLNGFLAHIGPKRAAISISGVTASDIGAFQEAEKAAGKGGSSVNLAVTILRAVFNDAKRKGLILANPAAAVELISEVGNEKLPFSDTEIEVLLAIADSEWRGMILLGAHLGLRLGDAAKITWDNVDVMEQTLTLVPQKTARRKKGKAQTVAMHRELVGYFENLSAPDDPAPPVFPNLKTKTSGGHQGLSNAFSKLMIKACIRQKNIPKRTGKGRGFNASSFHSLRHTFISRLANANISADVRKEIVGHSSDEIHRRYTHLDLGIQRKALDQIRGFTAG